MVVPKEDMKAVSVSGKSQSIYSLARRRVLEGLNLHFMSFPAFSAKMKTVMFLRNVCKRDCCHKVQNLL